jgi:hypothetical protein
MINAARVELRKSTDADSWGTSCLSPGLFHQVYCHQVYLYWPPKLRQGQRQKLGDTYRP